MSFPATSSKTRSIVLIGLMGCGKSSVGRHLAKVLKRPFVDVDDYIELEEGCSISQLFEQKGEAYFRQREAERIGKLLTSGLPYVIATGGGAFMQEAVRDVIAKHGISVWISAPFELILERVERKNNRPLLEKGDKATIVKNLMDERYPVYAQADITVDSSDGPHHSVVEQIVQALGR